MAARLTAVQSDISALAVEAIVNAANEALIMGGGVDGAIRRKAGPQMEIELRGIGRCPTGEAVLTRGYALPAKFVVHTVAPIWSRDERSRDDDIRLLSRCYENALAVARANGISEIAFPCLGTGIYGWPADLAAHIAFESVCESVQTHDGIAQVIFCCFSRADLERYNTMVRR
ncbi:MAG TPA: macro domain-containing protein [Rhizomicrobium sp.]|jgi:O-acetyl-ADP-ribose deacetylase (regulator of RNase III)|nr:macro domain-containing protein [Rhizomicrobium sp.]